MSMLYQLDVEAKGISEAELRGILLEEFGWDESNLEQLEGIVLITGDGNLRNVQTEEDMHHQIYQSLKSLRSDCQVKTKWTCLENLPFSVYGDDLDDE